MKPLLLASGNAHKLEEFRQLLPKIMALEPAPEGTFFPPEDRETYFGNACLKAMACYPAPGHFILADDSGLEVDALDGRPGLLSSRFAGAGASALMNCQALIRELKEVPSEKRSARFRCVLVLLDGDSGNLVAASQGVTEGRLTRGILGDGGFGYDPLFIPEGYQVTFGILPATIKHRISHRARAVRNLISILEPEPG
uniref:dITP/XTP pyrophosphatase n=1 Tax=Leptospirillum ferriphilum TaxID=178606 RepID=A0A7C3QT86_9BACT